MMKVNKRRTGSVDKRRARIVEKKDERLDLRKKVIDLNIRYF